jgi:hypothetical protein
MASAGAARGHSASAANSADTGRGARTANNANSARCLPAGTPTTCPLTRGSTGPSSAISKVIGTAQHYARSHARVSATQQPCKRHGRRYAASSHRSRKETTVPFHTPTVLAPRRSSLALIAALAATCSTAGVATNVIADEQSAPRIDTIGEPSQPATSGYFDIEANKAASMSALGLRIAQHRSNGSSRHEDIEANKARSQRAR